VSRLIKFRIWNANKRVWCETYSNVDLINDDLDQSDDGYFIEQFTGLLDLQGKEIYEGDIVFAAYTWPIDDEDWNEDKELFEVVWKNTQYGRKPGWELVKIKDKDLQFYGEWPDSQFIKIAGNVHQNPELLST
jgi:uncharacterized phage protein (TIGR01671 family)